MSRLLQLRFLARNAEILLDPAPEELGAKIIAAMKSQGMGIAFTADDAMDAMYPRSGGVEVTGYPRHHEGAVEQAILEAWGWLEAQGLIVKAGFANGSNGWRQLSRRANRMTEEDVESFAVATSLPRDLLHPRIAARVWSDFVRGHYDSAVLYAAKQVEIRVREAVGAGNDRYGVPLMNDAFNEENGILIDRNALIDERKARRNLFLGFIGAYKNPLSHRDVDIDDPTEAIELVLMASHLLRIVDLREAALKGNRP